MKEDRMRKYAFESLSPQELALLKKIKEIEYVSPEEIPEISQESFNEAARALKQRGFVGVHEVEEGNNCISAFPTKLGKNLVNLLFPPI